MAADKKKSKETRKKPSNKSPKKKTDALAQTQEELDRLYQALDERLDKKEDSGFVSDNFDELIEALIDFVVVASIEMEHPTAEDFRKLSQQDKEMVAPFMGFSIEAAVAFMRHFLARGNEIDPETARLAMKMTHARKKIIELKALMEEDN